LGKKFIIQMKTINQIGIIATILCLFVLISCKKETVTNDPLPTNDPKNSSEGLVCAVGNPMGAEVTKTIGTTGGTLQSEDGFIKVIIPAGAVNSDREFSLQSVENTVPSGIGASFKLTPHGEQFAKPVKIQFYYAKNKRIQADNTGIAYQDAKGIWQSINKIERDTVAKTVTIETTHFSNWAFFELLSIEPRIATVALSSSITLKAVEWTEDQLVPTPNQPIVYKSAKNVSNWTLGGAGVLTANGSQATYTAPNKIPKVNPVAVSVEVAGKSKKLLVSNIYIGGEGIYFKINNADEWTHAPVPIAGLAAADWSIVSGPPFVNNKADGSFSIRFLGGRINDIQYSWNPLISQFQYTLLNTQYYSQHYMIGKSMYVSPGYLYINKYGKVGEYISGEFLLEKAGHWEPTNLTNPYLRTVTIEGFFNVKRTQ
jgi:hypothetical protein